MTVEIIVSRREGHVTFAVSALTCWRKVNGLVVFDAICRSVFEETSFPCRDSSGSSRLRGRCPARAPKSAPNQRFSFAHAFRTRKAGFPAPRAACLSRLHKTNSQPRKWRRSSFMSKRRRRNHPIVRDRLCVYRRCDCISGEAGRGNRARTCDLRFWRPPLYQLSYTPMRRITARQALPKDFRRSVKSAGTGRAHRFSGCHTACDACKPSTGLGPSRQTDPDRARRRTPRPQAGRGNVASRSHACRLPAQEGRHGPAGPGSHHVHPTARR